MANSIIEAQEQYKEEITKIVNFLVEEEKEDMKKYHYRINESLFPFLVYANKTYGHFDVKLKNDLKPKFVFNYY